MQSAAFSSDGEVIAVGYDDGLIKLASTDQHNENWEETVGRQPGTVYELAFSPEGKVLTASAGGGIRQWNTSAAAWQDLAKPRDKIWANAFSDDWSVSLDNPDEAPGSRTTRTKDGAALEEFKTGETLALSPDGKIVALSEDSARETVTLRNSADGKEIQNSRGWRGRAESCRLA